MQYYKEQVLADIKDWAKEYNNYAKRNGEATLGEIPIEEIREILRDEDAVTGSGSKSYFCNTAEAKKTLYESDILFDEDFRAAVESLGITLGEIIKRGAETTDVWARCAALDALTDSEIAEAVEE